MDDLIDTGARQTSGGECALHRADDVAAFAHPPQRLIKALRQPPAPAAEILGEPELFQLLQPTRTQALLKRIALGRRNSPIGVDVAEQPAIDRRQPFLADVVAQPRLDFEIGARAEIERHQLACALAHSPPDIFAGDDQILIAIILASEHDVGVRVTGVEMIDSDPVKPSAEVGFHLRHQPPHEGFEIRILIGILGRDDEAELMAIPAASIEERLAVSDIIARRVKLPGLTLARHPIALDVAQVRPRAGEPLAAQPDQPGFDDRAARPEPAQPVATGEHAPDACAAADAAAVEAAVADARSSAGARGGGNHLPQIAAAAL